MTHVDIEDNTDFYIEYMDKAVDRALAAIGLAAVTFAQGYCPVVTGRLRNSIVSTVSDAPAFTHNYTDNAGNAFSQDVGSGGAGSKMVKYVVIGTNVEYGPTVEFGLRGRTPKRFITRAASDHMSEYMKILENETGL